MGSFTSAAYVNTKKFIVSRACTPDVVQCPERAHQTMYSVQCV